MTKQQPMEANGNVAELEHAELAAIYELGQAINANLALDQTATAALQGILKAVSPDLAFLFLREGDRLVLQHMLPPSGPPGLRIIPEHRVGHCMCGLAVSEGKALYSRNIHDDRRCTWDECKEAGLVSFAALPLRSADEIIGVIGLASGTERDFEKQGRFLETLASQVSVAIANARLHEALQRELTERKRAQQSLREDEEMLRIAFDNAPMGMNIVGADGQFVSVNPAFCQMVGYSREELLSGALQNITHPDDVEPGNRWMRRMISGDLSQPEFEKRYIHKDGRIVWVVVRARWVRDAAGAPRFSVAHVQDITEKRRAEQAIKDVLKESEERFSRLAQASFEGIAIHDEGLILDANQAMADLFGYELSELIGMNVLDLAAPQSRGLVRNMFLSGCDNPYEAIGLRKDGATLIGELRGGPINYQGRTVRVTAVRDITERKLAEEALQKNEEKFRIAFENAPTGMVRAGPDGRFLAVNPMYCQMVGYTSEELLAGNFGDITLPDDVERSNLWVRKQLSGDLSQPELEKRYIHKDGRIIWAVVRARWVRDAAGAPRFSVAHVQDITEKRRAEQEAMDALALNQAIVDKAATGILLYKASGQCVLANQAAAATIGATVEQLLAQNFRQLASWKRDGLLQAAEEALESGSVVGTDLHVRTTFGVEVWFLAHFVPVMIHGEKHLLFLFENILERKRAADRNRKLQEQLYQAQKMEAIGTLAGGIAHDFNNILAGIMGRLSLLELKLGEPGTQEPDIQESKALVGRGADLAKQLLGFARGGKYDVRPLDLAHVVEKMSSMFGRTRTDITIQLDFAPGLLAVLMDRTQLDQALLNLLLNASQAMPDGGRLLLHAENTELGSESEEVKFHGAAPGRFIKLLITDTGHGMDAATQARIFEPFFTTKDVGQGTGLGLASVYGIIKGHGGFIRVESQPGEGATFTLLLPATDRRPVSERALAALIQHGRGTILVVDDDELVLKGSARMLEQIGYDVLTASGGKQAIELLRQQGEKISLVVLDMTMPEMSGSETYDRLMQIAPGAKVLLCSGFSIEGQAQKILARGCNGFIQKPFDIATLSAKLLEIL